MNPSLIPMRSALFVIVYLSLLIMLSVSFLLPAHLVVESTSQKIPADGFSRAVVRLQVYLPFLRRHLFPHPSIAVEILQGSEIIQVFPSRQIRLNGDRAQFFAKSRAVAGQAEIQFSIHNASPVQVMVTTYPVDTDADQDGFPDSMRLNSFSDRDHFRRALATVAELQFYNPSPLRLPDQQDCGGLVRFAIREALRRHSDGWMNRFQPPLLLPSVEKYNFPMTPLGKKIFRTRDGPYVPADQMDGGFSEFVDVSRLKQFNTVFISRDTRQAQKGDLLFFHQPWVPRFPYHVMIVLKEAEVNPDGNNDWVVYHTGPSSSSAGEVKKVRIATLEQHPDPRWRTVESNKNFLGVFRLKIMK